MSNIVAIVGRPNVGKSTLFNRLTETRQAIVDEFSGVTRDRHYGKSIWGGKEFSVIDTGGYMKDSDDVFDKEISRQVEIAIEEATAIIFMVDVMTGITDLDEDVANLLRRSKKPIFLVANKVDNNERQAYSAEFWSFGLGDVYNVSAINGSGTGELLDDLIKKLNDPEPEEESELPRIAVVGKPNVGKSSMVNAFLGKERNIVTNIAGTTRDSVDTHFSAFDKDLVLIDTAGLRKKSKVHEDLEFYSVMRSVRAIEHADVCLLVIDATEGIQAQDMNVFHLIEKNKKGVVIVINKWDLVEKETNTARDYEERVRQELAPFNDVPIVFTSAVSKQRLLKALEMALKVHESRTRKISTSRLNDIMLPHVEAFPPPSVRGKYIKIKFITQLPTYAPSFAFFCNYPKDVRDPYKRYLENKLRKEFDFEGVPISIFMRQK